MSVFDRQRLDPGAMYDAIQSFPRQLREGRERAASVDPGPALENARCVVVSGMGGSAIAGDLLASLAASSAPVPIIVSRSYRLPAYVDERALVIVSSYSGNTEETLSSMDEAQERGARIICITAGGEVAARAKEQALPVYQLQGGLQPRAALGYSLSTLLTVAEQIGLFSVGAEAWEEAATVLDDQSTVFAAEQDNPALELARALVDRYPFVYSGSGIMAPVGTRWCCQIEENAKVLAHGNVLPEQNHNEIVGWEEASRLHEDVVVIALHDRMDHPRVVRRFELTRALVRERGASWVDLESRGGSDLTRLLSLVQFGDWTSLYLAYLRGVDPTPVRLIERLKQGL